MPPDESVPTQRAIDAMTACALARLLEPGAPDRSPAAVATAHVSPPRSARLRLRQWTPSNTGGKVIGRGMQRELHLRLLHRANHNGS